MCGIVGCIGTPSESVLESVVSGLKALEYRGYDSAGVTAIVRDSPVTVKQVGRVENLDTKLKSQKQLLNANLAIGHTRWATHGAPTERNAHPHFNQAKTIYVVHNGIIENYLEIKQKLQTAGYHFISDTDTEVIPHLIDYNLKKNKAFEAAFLATLRELRGAYAIAAIYTKQPDSLYVARLSSPLIIGVGKDCHYIASDPTAIIAATKKVIYLNDYELAIVKPTAVKIQDIKKHVQISRQAELLDIDGRQAQLGDFPHFMLKEIYEAPQTVQAASRGRLSAHSSTVKLGGLENVREQLSYIDRIVIAACGTSYYAGLVGEYLIEEIAGIPVEVQLASEFKYRREPFSRSTALLAISQSGETADTIAALKKVENYGVLRLGIVNAVGSTIARLTDAGVYCHAGPEQSVASTKAFIAQVTVLAEIALYLSNGRSPLHKPLINELLDLPNKLQVVLETSDEIKAAAKKFANSKNFLFIGRGYAYPCALEGSLKLKELSYIHAEGYAAGEMKHGPLAMIDKNFPTLAIATDSPLKDKVLSNIEEIKARGGPVIAIATEGDQAISKLVDEVLHVPKTIEQCQPLLVAVVLQLFAYHMAADLKHNVDRPRNLAKSVTVE